MKVLLSLPLGMRVQKEREVFADDEEVIELFVHHFKTARRLERPRIGEPECQAGHLVRTRRQGFDPEVERVLDDVWRALDERHAAARAVARPYGAHIGIHRT